MVSLFVLSVWCVQGCVKALLKLFAISRSCVSVLLLNVMDLFLSVFCLFRESVCMSLQKVFVFAGAW